MMYIALFIIPLKHGRVGRSMAKVLKLLMQ